MHRPRTWVDAVNWNSVDSILSATCRSELYKLTYSNTSMMLSSYFPPAAVFRLASHRRFCASAILLRPSGDSFLFLPFLAGLFAIPSATVEFFAGLPLFLLPTDPPASNARARCNVAISRSIDPRISAIPITYSPGSSRGPLFHACKFSLTLPSASH